MWCGSGAFVKTKLHSLIFPFSGSSHATAKITHLMPIKNNAIVMELFIDQSNASTLAQEQLRITMMQITIEA